MKTLTLHMDFVSVKHYKPNILKNVFENGLWSVFEEGDAFVQSILNNMKRAHKFFVYYHKIKAFHNKKTVGWEGLTHKQYCYNFSNEENKLHIKLIIDAWYKKIPKVIECKIDNNNIGNEWVNNIYLFDNKQFANRREFGNYVDKYLESEIKRNVETV